MPWMGGKFVSDARSPLERLYGFEKVQADRDAMRRQQDMLRERQKILAQSVQAGQPGSMKLAFESPADAMKQSGILDTLDMQMPSQAGGILDAMGYQAPESIDLEVSEATPAQFDAEGAINRLYGIGDFEAAQAIVNDQYKDAMAGRVGAGGEKFFGNGEIVRGTDGKLYKQIVSNAGNTKLVPIEGDLVGGTKTINAGGSIQVLGRDGETIRTIDVTPTEYQQFQMDPARQAAVAGAEAGATERAKTEAKASGEQEATDKASAGVLDIAGKLRELAKGGYLGSSTADRLRYNSAKMGLSGGEDQRFLNTVSMEPLVTQLMLMGKPPGMGAMSDGEWGILKQSVADPTQYPNEKAYLKALDSFVSTVQGRTSAGRKDAADRKPMPSLPSPAQHNGRTIRDTKSGIRYRSNGSQWVRVQ